MKGWIIFQLIEKIGDLIFAKKSADKKKNKAIVIAIICGAVVLTIGGIVVAVIIMKKKGVDVNPKNLVKKIKAKCCKKKEIEHAYEEFVCEEEI